MNDGYSIRELTAEQFGPPFARHVGAVFEGAHAYSLDELLTEAERAQVERLERRLGDPWTLRLGAFDREDRFVGWTWGRQESRHAFHMVNSGVLPEHRRRGLYAALIDRCVAAALEQGFQLVYSRHCATNNAVIIPKLKAGFTISTMEIDDRHGVLVHLHRYANPERRRIMDYRSGRRGPDARIRKLFGL